MSAETLLRPAAPGDLPAVAAIYHEAVLTGTASFELEPPSDTEMARRWRDLTERGFPYLVALRGGEVAGYAYAGPYRPRPAYRFCVEDSVYVAPAAQGAGIGRALLEQVIALSERSGYRQMIAVISSGAACQASVGLHKALDFRQVGTIEGAGFKHGQWLDTILMQRALGDGASSLPPEISS